MEALRWKIDWQLNWSAVSVTRLAFFFFSRRLEFFFCLDSNFKISNRVCSHDICLVFFRSWTYILQISTHVFYCIRCILQVSTYVLRFQHVFTIGIILSATERHTSWCCTNWRSLITYVENFASKVEVRSLSDGKKGSRVRLWMDLWKQMSSSKCSFTCICGIFLPLNPSTTTVYAWSAFYPQPAFYS